MSKLILNSEQTEKLQELCRTSGLPANAETPIPFVKALLNAEHMNRYLAQDAALFSDATADLSLASTDNNIDGILLALEKMTSRLEELAEDVEMLREHTREILSAMSAATLED